MDENMNLSLPFSDADEIDIPLLEFCGVTKKYGAKKVLDELSFSISKGGVVGLLGPNGSGKTTVIKLINRLLTPDSGEVLINGNPPNVGSAKIISYLPEKNQLPTKMKVSSAVDFFAGFYADFDKAKAFEMLKALGLDMNARLNILSKGELEKVRLILSMSRNAAFYVLDEPLGGFDPVARNYTLDTIFKNYGEDASILISTHLISEVESMLDDVIFLSEGKAALCASVKAIHELHSKSVEELFCELYNNKGGV